MTAPARPRRADAVRNEQRVLHAAREVFAERGLAAGINEVAARAGVGKATVYRSWATKEDLITAVLIARVDWFAELARAAAAAPDPWTAYVDLLRSAADSAARSALLHAGLTATSQSPLLEARRAQSRAALQELLDVLAAAGRVRPDVTAREVTVLLCGAFRTLSEERVTDVGQWRRYADLVRVTTTV